MRIGLLGASKIAVESVIQPSHVLIYAQLSAVAARDKARAITYADEHQIETALDDYEALITSDKVDLIYNALPVSHHAYWTIRALEAGKHVLCEKPLAMNIFEAQRVVDTAKANGKRVIEAFHYIYHPAFQMCLDWLNAGKIGEINTIDAEFSAPIPDDGQDIRFRPALGGGAMMDLGVYTLHWVQTILDAEPKIITAEGDLGPPGVDERLSAQLEFTCGTQATLNTRIGATAPLAISLSIKGRTGEIVFLNPLAPQHGAMLQLKTKDETIKADINPITSYAFQLASIIGSLETKEQLPTEKSGIIRQQRTLDKIYNAAGFGDLRQSSYP